MNRRKGNAFQTNNDRIIVCKIYLLPFIVRSLKLRNSLNQIHSNVNKSLNNVNLKFTRNHYVFKTHNFIPSRESSLQNARRSINFTIDNSPLPFFEAKRNYDGEVYGAYTVDRSRVKHDLEAARKVLRKRNK